MSIQAGKHVLVEKPLATRLSDAQELADFAEETELVLMPGHTFIYSPDTASDEPVRVFDRGIEVGPPTNFGEHQLTYRSGDVVSPRVQAQEPLRLELDDFARAIRTGEEPRSNVALGVQIVAAIELAQESLRSNGVPLALAPRRERAVA